MDYRTTLSPAKKGVSERHTHQENGVQALNFMKNMGQINIYMGQINICIYF
jgi:hypothetical protein